MLQRSLDRILDPTLLRKDRTSVQPNNEQQNTPTHTSDTGTLSTNDSTIGWMPEEWMGITADSAAGNVQTLPYQVFADADTLYAEFWSNLEDHSLMMFNGTDAFWPRNSNPSFS